MARRIAWLGVVMTVCFAALFFQLNNIQVVKAHRYATDPANPAVALKRNTLPRGRIQASDGTTVLAVSVANPDPKSSYKYLLQYPGGSLYSQIVGIDSIYYGLYGVEASYNNVLLSHNQPVRTLRDLLTTHTVTDTVTLTLIPSLQAEARNALGGKDGAIVVLNPTTGAIEAMYSNPTFDPNGFTSTDFATQKAAWFFAQAKNAQGFAGFTSLAYQDVFPPGSTFKTVTSSAAYDRAPPLVNKVQPTISCIQPGQVQGLTKPLCNFGHGSCGGTVPVMLPPSCDTGFALLGTQIGRFNMYNEAYGFGFDQQPPLDLPHSYNQISKFPTPQQVAGADAFLAYASIGQDYTLASPLQMAMVAGAIANHGVVMNPHVMLEVNDSQGNLVTRYQLKPWLTATSPATAASVSGLMQQVVQHGTAQGIFPPQDNVAAKTGTAQVGVGNTNTTDWMIAFAPANNPKVAIAVVVPNQPLSGTGAQVAGPIMNQMIQAALALP